MAEFCICGASRDQMRPRCYFSTDPTVDAFDFDAFFAMLYESVYTRSSVDTEAILAQITASLNFLSSWQGRLDEMPLDECERFCIWADRCQGWMDTIKSKGMRILGFETIPYYNYYSHLSHSFQRRINFLTAPAGMPPLPVLSSEMSCL